MQDKELYRRILGIEAPWEVSEVRLSIEQKQVTVEVSISSTARLRCPECGREVPGYDRRRRRWRDLDTHRFQTYIEADVPRVECPEHKVVQVGVPWAEKGSRLTAVFESLVIDWLQVGSISEVAEMMGLSWEVVDGVLQRAVKRGLSRRGPVSVEHLNVDETSFRKGHAYVTIVQDERTGAVVHVGEGRSVASLEEFYQSLSQAALDSIKTVSMDMWKPYIAATQEHVPAAEKKICFDKFHIAQHLGKGVDTVRREEHRMLQKKGDMRLKKSRYWWLKNPENLSDAQWEHFSELRGASLKTARAYALKETAMLVFEEYRSRQWGQKEWKLWFRWADRCQLEPIKQVASMIKEHLWGILNAMYHRRTNAKAEGVNRLIQGLKRKACGYRNKERFTAAIYFAFGKLDLYP